MTPRWRAAAALVAFFSAPGSFCAAADVAIRIKIPKDTPAREELIKSMDAYLPGRLNGCRKGSFDYGSYLILRYEASSWSAGQKDTLQRLYGWWGKANVAVEPPPGAPARPTAAPPPKAQVSPATTAAVEKSLAAGAAALSNGSKAFDNAAAAGSPGAAPSPTAAAGEKTAAAPPALASAAKKVKPKKPKEPPAADDEKPLRGDVPQEKLATIIFGEGSSFRPLWKDAAAQKAAQTFRPKKVTPEVLEEVERFYDPKSLAQLRQGRAAMALIADRLHGNPRKLARPITPSAVDLSNPGTAFSWNETKIAAAAAKKDDALAKAYPKDCDHFVMFSSLDGGKTPEKSPDKTPPDDRMVAEWPYSHAHLIKHPSFGPFRNPQPSWAEAARAKAVAEGDPKRRLNKSDVPWGENIYIFVYCGVP